MRRGSKQRTVSFGEVYSENIFAHPGLAEAGTYTTPIDSSIGTKEGGWNDTEHFLSGDGAVHVTIDGAGGDSFFQLRFSHSPAKDFSAVKKIVFWVYSVDHDSPTVGADNLNIFVRLRDDGTFNSANRVALNNSPGVVASVYSSADGFKAFELYLAEGVSEGSGAALSNINAVEVQFDNRSSGGPAEFWLDSIYLDPISRPCVVWTFDDAFESVLTEAHDYMSLRGKTGAAFVADSQVGGSGRLTYAQCRTLYGAGWQIGNHSINGDILPSGTANSSSGLVDNLSQMRSKLIEEGMPDYAGYVAFPGNSWFDSGAGILAADTQQLLKDSGFIWARGSSTSERAVSAYGHPSSALQLAQDPLNHTFWMNMQTTAFSAGPTSGAYSSSNMRAALDSLVYSGGSGLIMCHNIVASGATGNEINRADFRDAFDICMEYEDSGALDVLNLEEYLSGIKRSLV